MKKRTLYILLPFLLTACQQKGVPSFHIEGVISEAENGTPVMLQIDQEQSLVVLDETKINDSKFIFNGRQDSAIECNITYMLKGNKMGATFFLENGEIKMDLSKETSSITGTPNNDRYQHFLNKFNTIYSEIERVNGIMPEDSTSNKEEVSQLRAEINQLNKQADELIANTIFENIDNPVGFYLLCRFNQNLNAEQQEKAINKLPLSKRRTSVIEDLRAQLSILPPDSIDNDTIDFEEFQ